jgi:CBS domain-containing protein
MRVRDVVAAKPDHHVVTVAPGATVQDLVRLLAQHNVGALVVSSDGSRVDGIVSERDVVRRLDVDAQVLSTRVEEIMTSEVHTCESSQGLDDLMSVMTQRRIRHVPVVDDGVMVGIVSIGDVVKHKIDALQFERDQLDSYVHQS